MLCYACTNQNTKEIPHTIIKGQVLLSPPPKNRIQVDDIDWVAIEKRRKKIGLITNAIRSGLNTPSHNGILDKEGN